ncbi:MAG: tRNA (cytidine(34)-2'-O)-methyltransferase [Deltaproteobacteria bacterium]|nr:tRNA (cytidine(34)-2'-O)-methyltransferase [Deltaproteobacteria bacterium]
MDVVLIHPTIPWNTGNIGRSCVSTDTHLHLVAPLGFELSDTQLKRAGLDYWPHLTYTVHDSLEKFLQAFPDRPKFLFSRFAEKLYWDVSYPTDAMLIFGSETDGLPDDFKARFSESLYRIPTPGKVRSLNLSTSVGIVLFEALRQQPR